MLEWSCKDIAERTACHSALVQGNAALGGLKPPPTNRIHFVKKAVSKMHNNVSIANTNLFLHLKPDLALHTQQPMSALRPHVQTGDRDNSR